MEEPEFKDSTPLPETDTGEAYGLSVAFVREIDRALEAEEFDSIRPVISELHLADLAELFNVLPSVRREALSQLISSRFDPELLTYLKPEIRDELLEYLGTAKSAEAIAQLETDDAVHVIEDLSKAELQEILEAVPEEAREDIIESLSYPENSAGRLMRRDGVCVPEFWTVGNAIDYLRNSLDLPEDFYNIFVMDPRFKPVGTVILSRVMQNKRDVHINTIMNTELHTIPTGLDQEEVANIFRKYGLVEAPVVNENGRLVGTITVDDVVDVMQEEGEEDILRLGGVAGTDFHASAVKTAFGRFWWLFINFVTAIAAAWVISHFEASIEKIVTLAVLMPIIASMGGNAGIQTVTVAVRALTTRDLKLTNARSVLFKEIRVGGMNGLLLGSISGLGIAFFFGNVKLAAVFAVAMFINLLVAGCAGVLIPLLFHRMKIDPAITSGVFLTMCTDIVGFFIFLGLATFVLIQG